MNYEEIVKKVKAIIVDKLGVEPSEVTETANFTNDLGADSLDTVELLMEFEKEFGVKIRDRFFCAQPSPSCPAFPVLPGTFVLPDPPCHARPDRASFVACSTSARGD